MENVVINQAVDSFMNKVKSKVIVRTEEQDTPKSENLYRELEDIKIQLEYANLEFNLETDFNMIDTHIFRIQTLESLRNYILKKAKQERVSVNLFDRTYKQKA